MPENVPEKRAGGSARARPEDGASPPGAGGGGPPRVRVKICGVTRLEDARHALAAGADYVGAVLTPGFARSVAPEVAAAYGVRGEATLVALLVDPGDAAAAAAAARTAGAGVIQLHGEVAPALLGALRDEGPWRLWKAVRVRASGDVTAALERWVGVVDGLVLDGFREGHAGGSGAAFPWSEVEPLRAAFPDGLALVVAGGLGPDNVAEAVRRLSPHVVDVSSGVEARPGRKDPALVRAFVERARAAGGSARGPGPGPGQGPEQGPPRAGGKAAPARAAAWERRGS